MKICDINPHIRFAQVINYKTESTEVNVFDCRIFCVLSGTAEVSIENQHYVLNKNTLFYCCAGSVYTIGSENGSNILTLNFDLDQSRNDILNCYIPHKLPDNRKIIYKNNLFVEECDFLNGHIFVKDNMRFCSDVEKIIKEFSEKKIYFRETSGAVLKKLLIDIYRTELAKSENSSGAVEKAIEYIKSEYNKKITNKDIASVAGYHEYHLNRLFLKHTGMTIHRYILETRLDEAKKQLINSDFQISMIAENCGFNSTAHFTSYFKQIYGCSPSKFKIDLKNKI